MICKLLVGSGQLEAARTNLAALAQLSTVLLGAEHPQAKQAVRWGDDPTQHPDWPDRLSFSPAATFADLVLSARW